MTKDVVDEAGDETFPASDPPAWSGTHAGPPVEAHEDAPPAGSLRPSETIMSATETPGHYPQRLRVRTHSFRADMKPSSGGTDDAPGPHDYFDAALASCKALTALWFAKNKSIDLHSVDVRVDRDDRTERSGHYALKVFIAFHGTMDESERAMLFSAVSRCPIHRLMTTSDVVILSEMVARVETATSGG